LHTSPNTNLSRQIDQIDQQIGQGQAQEASAYQPAPKQQNRDREQQQQRQQNNDQSTDWPMKRSRAMACRTVVSRGEDFSSPRRFWAQGGTNRLLPVV